MTDFETRPSEDVEPPEFPEMRRRGFFDDVPALDSDFFTQPATAEKVDHAHEARRHIDWAHEQQAAEGEFEHSVQDNATLAVAEATLALVEQQRLANMIAWQLGTAENYEREIRRGLNR